MSRLAAVLFDVDGTLITSGGAGAESWKRAFDDLYGVPADIAEFTDNGMTDPEVARRTFARVVGHEPDAEELARVMAKRLEHLPAAVAESKGYKVLPGVAELLPRLRDAGLLLGLTTGGTEDAARVKLERGHLNEFFAFGGFGSDSEDRVELTRCGIARAEKRLGQPLSDTEICVVGDTPHDVAAAEGAGAGSIAVASGNFSLADLRATHPDHLLGSLTEEFPL